MHEHAHRQARLIYNPTAGSATTISLDDLLAALAAAGYTPQHDPTPDESDIDKVLERPADLVVAAGGDGTVRAVATRLVGRAVPLAIIPLGTANNVAEAVGIRGLPPLELIKTLGDGRIRRLDVGVVKGPWGVEYFLESAGVGLFADLLQAYSPEQGRSLWRAVMSAVQVVPGYQARDWRLTLDGVGLSQRYLLIEAMNTPCLGMRNCLAPDADPSDGRLDIVLVSEDDRVGLLAYLTQTVAGTIASLPNVTVRPVRHLRLEWDGAPIHVDEALRIDAGAATSVTLEIEAIPGALEILTPAAAGAGAASAPPSMESV